MRGRRWMAAMAGLVGLAALAGLAYDSGWRPGWLDRFFLNWMMSSNRIVERAYEQMFAGDTAGALRLFDLAVRRDSASAYRWCDYAEALLQAGDRERAERCMRRGLELGPHVGPVQMRGMNFAYRVGDRRAALERGRRLLAMTEVYDEAVFTVWERMGTPPASALGAGIGGARAARAYLRWRMRQEPPSGADEAWAWALARGFVDDPLADAYVDFLVRAHEPGAAQRAWAASAGRLEPGYPAANAVFNGSFERPPAGTVFDWRIWQTSGARIERDPSVAADGRYSLRLTFDGSSNIAFGNVSQRTVLAPGKWRFEARVRTEGITTDEGVGFAVFDAEVFPRMNVETGHLRGTNDWTPVSAVLRVPPATRLVEIRIVRSPSWKFDNKIAGTAWVDSVALRRF